MMEILVLQIWKTKMRIVGPVRIQRTLLQNNPPEQQRPSVRLSRCGARSAQNSSSVKA